MHKKKPQKYFLLFLTLPSENKHQLSEKGTVKSLRKPETKSNVENTLHLLQLKLNEKILWKRMRKKIIPDMRNNNSFFLLKTEKTKGYFINERVNLWLLSSSQKKKKKKINLKYILIALNDLYWSHKSYTAQQVFIKLNIYIYIYSKSKVGDRSRGQPEGSLFNRYYTEL